MIGKAYCLFLQAVIFKYFYDDLKKQKRHYVNKVLCEYFFITTMHMITLQHFFFFFQVSLKEKVHDDLSNEESVWGGT